MRGCPSGRAPGRTGSVVPWPRGVRRAVTRGVKGHRITLTGVRRTSKWMNCAPTPRADRWLPMKRVRRILLPSDFSDSAATAGEFAADLALRYDAGIDV